MAQAVRKYRKYSREDKALFFEAKERLGTVTAAARELVFTRSTCLMWTKDDGRAPGTRYSAEQKAEFFVLLDRLGSVSAAARQLGINTQTAFSWSYSLTAVERKPQGKPTARQLALAPKKAEFLAVLERVGNISVAAREVGVKRSQGESWARAAGVENILQSRAEEQAEYTRLREEGATQKAASAIVGVNRRTGYDWDQAARAAKSHADADQSADTAYTCEVPTALAEPDSLLKTAAEPFEAPGLTLMPELPTGCQETLTPPIAAAPSTGPSEAPALPVVPPPRTVTIEHLEQVIDPRYLSQQERELIADMLRAEEPIRAIGRALGRTATKSGIIGFDGALRTSPDGRTWNRVAADFVPAVLAGNPTSDTVLATTPEGIRRSTDGGKAWTTVNAAPVVQFAAFAGPSEAVGVEPDGTVHTSADAGATWTRQGKIQDTVQAVAAVKGPEAGPTIWAATASGIVVSTDGGVTFRPGGAD